MKSKSIAIWALTALSLIAFAYTSWLLFSNFQVDDLGQIPYSDVPYEKHVSDWVPLWGYRPVSLFLLPAFIHLFGTLWFLYSLLNSLFFGFSIWVYFWKAPPINTPSAKILGIFLAATPAIASTVIFSPVNQIPATTALAVAATAHLVANQGMSKIGTAKKLIVLALFCVSLLTYEIALPLIIWTCLAGKTAEPNGKWSSSIKTGLFNLWPAIGAIVTALLWQKIGAPILLESDFSRAKGTSLYSLSTFAYALIISLPAQLFRVAISNFLPFVALTAFLLLGFKLFTRTSNNSPAIQDRNLLKPFILSLATCGGLFFSSGATADLTGYVNRGLTSTWLLLVIGLLLFCFKFVKRRFVASFVIAIVGASNFLWFAEKVEESNSASTMRIHIADQIAERTQRIDKGIVLVADVPCLLPKAESDIEIFCTAWDLDGALKIRGIKLMGVLPRWDWGFDQLAKTTLVEGSSFLYMEFSDNGDFVDSTIIEYQGVVPRVFGRSPGGKFFLANDCFGLLSSTGSVRDRPSSSDCIVNPH